MTREELSGAEEHFLTETAYHLLEQAPKKNITEEKYNILMDILKEWSLTALKNLPIDRPKELKFVNDPTNT